MCYNSEYYQWDPGWLTLSFGSHFTFIPGLLKAGDYSTVQSLVRVDDDDPSPAPCTAAVCHASSAQCTLQWIVGLGLMLSGTNIFFSFNHFLNHELIIRKVKLLHEHEMIEWVIYHLWEYLCISMGHLLRVEFCYRSRLQQDSWRSLNGAISKCRVLHIHCAPLAEISPQLRPVYNNWFLLSSNGSDNCQATIDFTRVYT